MWLVLGLEVVFLMVIMITCNFTDGVDIRKKVNIRKPIFEIHFMDVGAVCPNGKYISLL